MPLRCMSAPCYKYTSYPSALGICQHAHATFQLDSSFPDLKETTPGIQVSHYMLNDTNKMNVVNSTDTEDVHV